MLTRGGTLARGGRAWSKVERVGSLELDEARARAERENGSL